MILMIASDEVLYLPKMNLCHVSESSSSSSSSYSDWDPFLLSSSDEELQAILLRNKPAKNENYIENIIPNYNDDKAFIKEFRINRHMASDLANEFQNSGYFHYQAGGHGKIGSLQELLIFLSFVGHQRFTFRDVAEKFYISISTLHRIIRRVARFLSQKSNDVITWPTSQEKELIERHFRFNKFPGVIGCIDLTHIKIAKPGKGPEIYLNTKNFYSIQLQVVCDYKKRIRDISVGSPGSVSDSRVFFSSSLCQTLNEKCEKFCILGDEGYPCLENLLTPFPNNHLSIKQKNFNMKHSLNHFLVEQCFTTLRQKFRQLNYLKLKSMDDIVHLIKACCTLHNLSLDDEFDYEEMEFVGNFEQYDDSKCDEGVGLQRRNQISDTLSM